MVWQWPILRQISPRKLNVCQSNFTNNITTTNKLRPPFCWRTSLSVLVAAIPRSFDIHACGKRCMSRMDCQSIKQSVAILYSCYCIISFLKSLFKKTTHFFVADWKGGWGLWGGAFLLMNGAGGWTESGTFVRQSVLWCLAPVICSHPFYFGYFGSHPRVGSLFFLSFAAIILFFLTETQKTTKTMWH